jgi:hypothetical protein
MTASGLSCADKRAGAGLVCSLRLAWLSLADQIFWPMAGPDRDEERQTASRRTRPGTWPVYHCKRDSMRFL